MDTSYVENSGYWYLFGTYANEIDNERLWDREDTNSIFNSMMKSMSDLETKIVDEYIWENYKKHASETPEQKVEDLISQIKDLEIKMYNYTKETKSKHYCQIKESNDKIQSIYSEIMIQWGNNISFYKENI